MRPMRVYGGQRIDANGWLPRVCKWDVGVDEWMRGTLGIGVTACVCMCVGVKDYF